MKPYYEGWYLKHQQGGRVLAIIPGRAAGHAFIQAITPGGAFYAAYPLSAYHKTRAGLRVGRSLFTPHGSLLDIRAEGFSLEGRFAYRSLTPLRYGIMGPFAPLGLETRHEVRSMRHRVRGRATLNGEALDFSNGEGYWEGDRGTSFPQSYTWFQALLPGGGSVMAAVAKIPLAGLHFTGCIAVVSLAGREYRLATYLGVHIKSNTPDRVELCQRGLRLVLEPRADNGHALKAPAGGRMQRPIYEHPAVPALVSFYKDGEPLIAGATNAASFEFVP